MKIKITQAGWAGFTGNLGGHHFENAVSVDDMSRADAQRIAAVVQVEEVDTGKNPSIAQVILDHQNTMMDEAMPAPDYTELSKQHAEHMGPDSVPYLREELEKIAEQGIQALRAIADPIGIRANSIVKLIDGLVHAGARKPLPKPEAKPSTDVVEPAPQMNLVEGSAPAPATAPKA